MIQQMLSSYQLRNFSSVPVVSLEIFVPLGLLHLAVHASCVLDLCGSLAWLGLELVLVLVIKFLNCFF